MPGAFRIDRIRHPHHLRFFLDWEKWRLTFEGGRLFKDEFLVKFSKREKDADFKLRKKVSYVPAHAKAAVLDVRNSIYQRMIDITRIGGATSYMESIKGLDKGVDNRGSSMDVFMGKEVLTELCILGRVGVYVDKADLSGTVTLNQTQNVRPYLYFYQAEDIFSWRFDAQNNLTHVLLRDREFTVDESTGLVDGLVERFRLLELVSEGVRVRFFNFSGKIQQPNGFGPKQPPELIERSEDVIILNLREIPFVIGELSHSLMTDIADIQIALLNLASSDISYALKSNWPFFTEQYHPQDANANTRPAGADAKATTAQQASTKEVNVGVAQGRRYPKGVDRPGFINPDSGPLLASMQKQEQLRAEILQILNLSVADLKPIRASAESKKENDSGLEAGLSAIGLTMETMERSIGRIWSQYEAVDEVPTVKYPSTYQIRSEADRRQEAKEIRELLPTIPSKTFQKVAAKDMVRILQGHKIDEATLKKINSEIDNAPVIVTDPKIIKEDHEAGFVSTDTASIARGYDEGESEQARKDHAERLALIREAQTAKEEPTNLADDKLAARGVPDGDPDPQSGVAERAEANNLDTRETTADPTRGEGQGEGQ